MDYVIFARKFRPQTFEDVVGQEPITTTLKNAIRQKRIPQSFLFSGPRGVGKTSTARILAKALNCEKGPTETPCGKCVPCEEIAQGNSLDVLEIDGASNRGIDEIRNLRETVKFKPVTGRVKIYIIDEVHMLTTEAFNALLKTLEEPPSHVKFIFATTEPHKVPMTILSRCQRFNFKRIPTPEIAKKLEGIAKKEKLKIDKNVLFLVAKSSDGALRDAESLLDQLASFSGGKIGEEDVLLMLGLASEEVMISVLSALKDKDVNAIFRIVQELYDGGRDLVQFAKELLETFRNLLLLQCLGSGGKGADQDAAEYIEMSEEGLGELKKKTGDFSRGELILALSILGNLQNQLRRNLAPPKLLVETVLLKLLHLDSLRSVNDALSAPQGSQPAAAAPSPGKGSWQPAAPSYNRKNSPQGGRQSDGPKSVKTGSGDFRAAHTGGAQATAELPEAQAGVEVSPDQISEVWPRIIEYVKTKKMSTGIFLSESSPVEVSESGVTLGLPSEFQFHKDTLEKDINYRLVQEGFEVVCGRKVKVHFVITKPDQAPEASVPAPSAQSSDDAKMPDIVNEAMDIFSGAKIIRKE